ncbi:MAG: O-antigen ligase family protein [Clostridia bacterium]|nr:O-antigen ligase family protein [Clostridia bacterium]
MAKKNTSGSSKRGLWIAVAILLVLILIAVIREKPIVGVILLLVAAAAVTLFVVLKKKRKTPTKLTKTSENPDGEKDFDYMPEYEGQSVLRYQYEHDLFLPPDVDAELLRGNGGKYLELRPEPENEYDEKAVAVYLKDAKIGYIYKGQTQDMIHDWLKRKEPINIYLNKFSVENRKATYKIGFYKLLRQYECKTFPITRITKKASDEWSNSRLEALDQTEIGEVLTLDEEEGGGYSLINESNDEIGSLSKSGAKYIDENKPMKAVGVLAEKDIADEDDDEPDTVSAKVTVYLVK